VAIGWATGLSTAAVSEGFIDLPDGTIAPHSRREAAAMQGVKAVELLGMQQAGGRAKIPTVTTRLMTRMDPMRSRISSALRISPSRGFCVRRSGLRSFSHVMPKPGAN
jgi:hypothetical protein